MKKIHCLLCLWLPAAGVAQADSSHYFYDRSGTFSEQQVQVLETKLAAVTSTADYSVFVIITKENGFELPADAPQLFRLFKVPFPMDQKAVAIIWSKSLGKTFVYRSVRAKKNMTDKVVSQVINKEIMPQ